MRVRMHTICKITCRCQVPLLRDQTVAFELRPVRSSATGPGSGPDQQAGLYAETAQQRGASAGAAQHSAAGNPGQGTGLRGFQLWDASDAAAPAVHLIPSEWREVRRRVHARIIHEVYSSKAERGVVRENIDVTCVLGHWLMAEQDQACVARAFSSKSAAAAAPCIWQQAPGIGADVELQKPSVMQMLHQCMPAADKHAAA